MMSLKAFVYFVYSFVSFVFKFFTTKYTKGLHKVTQRKIQLCVFASLVLPKHLRSALFKQVAKSLSVRILVVLPDKQKNRRSKINLERLFFTE